MLHRAATLLRHDFLTTCILEALGGRAITLELWIFKRIVSPAVTGAVGYGQVEEGRVAEQEHGDVQAPGVGSGWEVGLRKLSIA